MTCPKNKARPIRHPAQVPDRNGKIFYTSITSLSHISKESGDEAADGWRRCCPDWYHPDPPAERSVRLIFSGRRLPPLHITCKQLSAPPWQTDSYHKRKRIANRIFTFILKGRCYYADFDSPYFSAQPAQDPDQSFFLMGGGTEWKQFSKQSPIGSSHC